jgi:L-serine deaminase
MGLMDKVKAQAEQAMAKAQQGVSQGQAKLDAMQAKKQADALLRDLGAAYYAAERQNASMDAVHTALARVDEHAATQGGIDTAATAGTTPPPAPDTAPATAADAAPGSAPAAPAEGPAQSFNLDDI